MNLTAHTIRSAIRYSMTRNCFANIIVAGPICSEKRIIAESLWEWLDIIGSEALVSIFSEEDYLKECDELEDNKFGTKNIDLKAAYDVERFIQDVETYIKNGSVFSKVNKTNVLSSKSKFLNDTAVNEKYNAVLNLKKKRKINIFTGPHAIELLKDGKVEIPKAIFIFINADLTKCMERRIESDIMIPNIKIGSEAWEEYCEFIKKQIEDEIYPQKEQAQIVINCD